MDRVGGVSRRDILLHIRRLPRDQPLLFGRPAPAMDCHDNVLSRPAWIRVERRQKSTHQTTTPPQEKDGGESQ